MTRSAPDREPERLSAQGQYCEWVGSEDGKDMVLSEEPDSTPWLRFKLGLLRMFVPESLL